MGGPNVEYDFLEGVEELVHRPRGYYSRDGQVGKEMHLSRRDEQGECGWLELRESYTEPCLSPRMLVDELSERLPEIFQNLSS